MTVTSYLLQDGSKRWQYRFAFNDGSGVRRYAKHKRFRTKADAERAEIEQRHKLNAGEGIRHGEGIVGDFLRLWLTRIEASQSVKPSTLASYRNDLTIYVIPRIGSLQLRKLSPTVIGKLYGDLLTNGRIQRTNNQSPGLRPKSVRNIAGTLHKALQDGVKWQLFPNNPCDAVDLPRWDRPEPKGWDSESTGRFLLHVLNADPLHYALFRLAFSASLRRGELLGLRWQDVDLVLNSVTIVETRTVIQGQVVDGSPKSRRSRRTEQIDPETGVALAQLKEAQEQSAQLAGGTWWSQRVATDLLGKPIHPLTFTRTFQRYVKEIGLPRINLHEVRHTSVFIAEQEGVSLSTISGRLGHADPGFTLRVYAPYLKTADGQAADSIGAAFDRAMRRAQIGHRSGNELYDSHETTRVQLCPIDEVSEPKATSPTVLVEATPGIEPG